MFVYVTHTGHTSITTQVNVGEGVISYLEVKELDEKMTGKTKLSFKLAV